MRSRGPLWVWNVLSGLCLLYAVVLIAVYAGLPVDGGTGDLASFIEEGFRVQWLLENRPDGLNVDDIIFRAGGHDVNEWLSGARRNPEWYRDAIVVYNVLRDDQPVTVNIRLKPVPFGAILARWGLQFAVALAFLILGAFVAWRRSQDLAARVMMFFCVTAAMQYVGDAYNFQYATIPWRWPFWLHFAYEYVMWGLSIASIAYFALLFPVVHPVIQRAPRLVPTVLFLALPVAVIPTIALLAPDWNMAFRRGSDVAWTIAMSQVAVALLAGFRSIRVVRDPVARAQVRWILWSGVIGCAILMPGYVVPLLVYGKSLLPHPLTMLITALIPLSLAVAILRYRLFDIQVIVNQTLVYVTLTVLLAGIYFGVVRVFSLAAEIFWWAEFRENETLIVFVATITVALAVEPLRRRTQRLIDMAFYRTKLDYQRLLPEMSERLATQVVLEELADLLTYEIPARLQIRRAYLAVLDAGEKYFVPVGDENGNRLPAEHKVVGYLQRTGKPLSYLQPPADLPLPALEFLSAHQESALIIPLVVGGKLVGLYHLGLKRSGDAYTGDEVRLLHLLAQQAAIAVENSRLFQQTDRLFQAEREQRRLAQALQDAAAIVNRTLELDQVLARILEQVERVVPGDAFNIMLIEGDTARAVRWRGYEQLGVEESISSLLFKIADYPTLAYMQDSGQPIVIGDTNNEPRWVCREGWEWLRSYVSAPIQVGDQTVGFLNVDRTQPTSSGLEDGRRLEALAHHAATALEHARLYEQAQQELGERKWAEEKLKASLAEKEVLLQEIHHRVKNNLQVISSLLYLQSKGVHDPHVLAILQESRHRVRSMALVHEHLYQTEYPTHVDAAKYVRTLTNYLLRSYEVRAEQIKLQVEVDDLRLGIDTAVPCGLLINELVSNALKHAFPNGQRGEIQVSLQAMTNHDYRLIVGDDGIGLSGGLEGHNTDSLGLRLVQTLTQQLEGVIELDTSAGTRFEIIFPASDMYKGG